MKPIHLALAALLTVAAPAFAQHEHEGGHPAGPPPQFAGLSQAASEVVVLLQV